MNKNDSVWDTTDVIGALFAIGMCVWAWSCFYFGDYPKATFLILVSWMANPKPPMVDILVRSLKKEETE
jgi:hypothetical protein